MSDRPTFIYIYYIVIYSFRAKFVIICDLKTVTLRSVCTNRA